MIVDSEIVYLYWVYIEISFAANILFVIIIIYRVVYKGNVFVFLTFWFISDISSKVLSNVLSN